MEIRLEKKQKIVDLLTICAIVEENEETRISEFYENEMIVKKKWNANVWNGKNMRFDGMGEFREDLEKKST